ncbi:uncharacterized protein LOC123197566 isoform X1 [Mangifera indica]|uniref:uncharacterized protein LOC123197566 isoform X1 n=1 Tax=Mangifera indica TaxID=29780 RepID=UPI001CF97A55|nr:uncharacterized protein LOC123197566 isoform X1 [Mangifera indica]
MLLLETILKNCGDIVHMHVAERDVLHEMVKIVKKKPDFHVKGEDTDSNRYLARSFWRTKGKISTIFCSIPGVVGKEEARKRSPLALGEKIRRPLFYYKISHRK